MNFADFLRLRQQGNPPPPVGPFPGDRRMDAVEAQRGNAYPLRAAPGYVCFEDGSCVPEAEWAARQAATGPRVVTPQPTGRPATSGDPRFGGNAFASFLARRMARGGGAQPVRAYPSPSPSMDPRSVVCDERGENCRPVYMR